MRSEPPNQSAGRTLREIQRKHLTRSIMINLVVGGVMGALCAMNLDGGISFQIWYFTMAAYWSATLLIWACHRKSLTAVDLFIARWGIPIALVTVPFLMRLFWRLYAELNLR